MDEWGKGYGVAVIQDVIIIQTIKFTIMNVLAIIAAKPQLRAIQRVIIQSTLSLIQKGADVDDDIVRVIQHFSPACRAARMRDISVLKSAAILRNLNDADNERCLHFRNLSISAMITSLLCIVAVLTLISETLLDNTMDIVIAPAWSGKRSYLDTRYAVH